jgi:hypothetical protein
MSILASRERIIETCFYLLYQIYEAFIFIRKIRINDSIKKKTIFFSVQFVLGFLDYFYLIKLNFLIS